MGSCVIRSHVDEGYCVDLVCTYMDEWLGPVFDFQEM